MVAPPSASASEDHRGVISRIRAAYGLTPFQGGRIEDAVVRGSLARVWGIAERTEAAGWTPELIERYAPLLDPLDTPVMAPEAIVSVLGSHDDVTPFESGKALVERWRLPEENLFVWRCGHFSVPLAMLRDHRPLERFAQIMRGL